MGVKSTGTESLECCGRGDVNRNHPSTQHQDLSDQVQQIDDRTRPPPPPPIPPPPPPIVPPPLPRQFEQYHHIMSRQDLQNNNVYENYIDNHLYMNPMHDNYAYPYFLTHTPVDDWSTATLSLNNNGSHPTTPRSLTATFVDITDSTLTIGTDMSVRKSSAAAPSPLAMVEPPLSAKASPTKKDKRPKPIEKEKEKKKDKGISQSARMRAAAGRQAGGRGGGEDPLAGRSRRTTNTSKKETKKPIEEQEVKEKLLMAQQQWDQYM